MKTLDKFAPRKEKCSRGNNMHIMNKSLSRDHTKKRLLKNCYIKKRSEQNRISDAKQRNYCVSLFTVVLITYVMQVCEFRFTGFTLI